MPTDLFRRTHVGLSDLGLSFPPSYRPPMVLIGPWSREAIGEELTGMAANNFASTSYPAANRILAYPFELADYMTVLKMWYVTGTTASTDSTAHAVFSEDGATRLIYSAVGAPSVANAVQGIDSTDTLLPPGRYWCAYVQSGTTLTPMASATPAALLRSAGCAQEAGPGSGTMNATFTPAAIASAVMPLFGIAGRLQVS